MFLLTNCAACAAPLAHDAPRCVRCKTRYCNSTCQHDHWRRGHKQICKKIHRGGNAEQYHADNKYKEAVAVAVEECADMERRLGKSEESILNVLNVKSNLANTYQMVGRLEDALTLTRDVYFGFFKLFGEENKNTLAVAQNYASALKSLNRFQEAKSMLRKTLPVARRVLGKSNETTLKMSLSYGRML